MEEAEVVESYAGGANEANGQDLDSHTPRAEAGVDVEQSTRKDKSRKIKKAQRKNRSTSRTRLPKQESDSNLSKPQNDAGTEAQASSRTDENNAEEQVLVAQPHDTVQPENDELVPQAQSELPDVQTVQNDAPETVSTAEKVEHRLADFAVSDETIVDDLVTQLVDDEKADENAEQAALKESGGLSNQSDANDGSNRRDAEPQEESNATDLTAANEATDQNSGDQAARTSAEVDQALELNEPSPSANAENLYPHPPRAPRRSKSAKQRVTVSKPHQPDNEGKQQVEGEQPSRRQRPGSAKGQRLVPSAGGREQRLEAKYGELHGLLTQEFLVNTDDLIERQVRETKQLLQNYISTQRIVAHSEARHHVLQDRHEDASEWPEGRHARAFREAQQAQIKVHVQTSTSDADAESDGKKRLLRRSQTQAQSISATTRGAKIDQRAGQELEGVSYPSPKASLNRKNKENGHARAASANEPDGADLLAGYGLEVDESKRSKRSDNYLGHTDNPVVLKWLRAKNKELHKQRDAGLRQQREQMLLERFQQEQAEERKHAAQAAYKKWLHEINMRQNTERRARFDCKLDLSSPDDGDSTQLQSFRLQPFDDSNPHVLTSDECSDEDEVLRDARIKSRKMRHNYVFKHPLPPYRVKSGVSVSKCSTVRFKIRGQATSLQSSRPASTMPSTSRERTAMVTKSTISSETMALVREAQRYSAAGVIVTAKSRRPQSATVVKASTDAGDAGDAATSQSSRAFRPMHPKLSFEEWLERRQHQDAKMLEQESQRQQLALRLQQRNMANESDSLENGDPQVLLSGRRRSITDVPDLTQTASHASNDAETDNGNGDENHSSADVPSAEVSAQVIPDVQHESERRAPRPSSPHPPSIPSSDDENFSEVDLPV